MMLTNLHLRNILTTDISYDNISLYDISIVDIGNVMDKKINQYLPLTGIHGLYSTGINHHCIAAARMRKWRQSVKVQSKLALEHFMEHSHA